MRSLARRQPLLLLPLAGLVGAGLALTPASTAKPGANAPRPLAAARLAGEFDITTRVTAASNFGSKRGEKDWGTWKFTPLCSKGVCQVRLTFSVGGLTSAEREIKMRMLRSGAVYHGEGSATLSECFMEDVSGDISIRLQVKKGKWINDVWRATRVTGTETYTTPETRTSLAHCPAGKLVSAVVGTLSEGY